MAGHLYSLKAVLIQVPIFEFEQSWNTMAGNLKVFLVGGKGGWGREGREGRGGGGGMCTRLGNTYKLINCATPGSFINIV